MKKMGEERGRGEERTDCADSDLRRGEKERATSQRTLFAETVMLRPYVVVGNRRENGARFECGRVWGVSGTRKGRKKGEGEENERTSSGDRICARKGKSQVRSKVVKRARQKSLPVACFLRRERRGEETSQCVQDLELNDASRTHLESYSFGR